MHFQILRYIVLPNVGYWRGRKLVNEKELLRTETLLSRTIVSGRFYIKYLDGLIHSQNDLHAIELKKSSHEYVAKEWYKKGKRHRERDKPAVIYANGNKEWWINGELHRRRGKPAVKWTSGTKQWYKRGKFLRLEMLNTSGKKVTIK